MYTRRLLSSALDNLAREIVSFGCHRWGTFFWHLVICSFCDLKPNPEMAAFAEPVRPFFWYSIFSVSLSRFWCTMTSKSSANSRPSKESAENSVILGFWKSSWITTRAIIYIWDILAHRCLVLALHWSVTRIVPGTLFSLSTTHSLLLERCFGQSVPWFCHPYWFRAFCFLRKIEPRSCVKPIFGSNRGLVLKSILKLFPSLSCVAFFGGLITKVADFGRLGPDCYP